MKVVPMNKKLLVIIVLLSCIFIIYFYSKPLFLQIDPVFNMPDEAMLWNFSEQFHTTGSFIYDRSELLNNFPEEIQVSFMPRDASINQTNIVPQNFIWQYYVISILTIYNEPNNLFITILLPLFSLMTLCFAFLLFKEIFDKNIALISILFISIFPYFWYWSSRLLYLDILTISFFIAGLLFLIQSKFNNKTKLFLGTFFFCISMVLRPTYALLIAPIYILWGIKNLKNLKIVLLPLIIIILFGIIVLSPTLILNTQLYGSPIKTGYDLSYAIQEQYTGVNTSFLQINFEQILNNSTRYFIEISPLFFLLLIVGFFIILVKTTTTSAPSNKSWYALYILFILLMTLLIYGSRANWGFDKFYINASFARYMLLFFTLSIPIFVEPIIIVVKKYSKLTSTLCVFTFVILSVFITLFGPMGLIETNTNIISNENLRSKVLDNTESNAIIISQYYDKVIFPDRFTTTTAFLASNKLDVEGNELIWYIPVDENLLAENIILLYSSTHPIYLIQNSSVDIDKLNKILKQKNFIFADAISIEDLVMFRLSRFN